ncbi:MAG: hypothetical protein IJO63_04710 [Bacilli bacterium]|nr:hypothetical protein [Bacilli bacterium]
MSVLEDEKAILEQAPDFDNQIKILEEEHAQIVKKRKWYILIVSILLLIVIIFVVSYSTVYHYREYGPISNNRCENVNLKINGSPVPNLNITEGNDCKPIYSVDYYNNRKPTFNIDVYGDRTYIFNKMNQLDATGSYCIINCDADSDGWPDYNIDLNGDGNADLNIVSNPKLNHKCDLNCDINYDTIADVNIDIDGDGKADINIADENSLVPKYNIDYKGNREATFNVLNGDEVQNQVISVKEQHNCTQNCDIDGDGWPDYNIKHPNNNYLLNELVNQGNNTVYYNDSKDMDWKCSISPNLKQCKSNIKVNANKYINIDVDGDGKADVNISSDGGNNIVNPVNKKEGKVTLNIDSNNDGFPDYNIDVDNDGKADLNVIEGKEYICVKNCDTNNDGIADYLIDMGKELISIGDINADIDYDTKCDANCDTNYDLYPNVDIDVNKDGIPDVNIDYDLDGNPDFNIDTDGDLIPDQNLDAYGTGKCTFNCNGNNIVSSSIACTKNCDTDNDGWPDTNVDVDNDGICDFNCNNGTSNIDKDNNYYLDSEYDSAALLEITNSNDADFYIMNPLDIKSDSVEPGWADHYVLEVKNTAHYAVAYRIVWENVTNEFTDTNNLDYSLSRSNTSFLNNMKAPRASVVLKDNLIIKANSSAKFVMNIEFRETGINQNIDSGKSFRGQLKLEVIK